MKDTTFGSHLLGRLNLFGKNNIQTPLLPRQLYHRRVRLQKKLAYSPSRNTRHNYDGDYESRSFFDFPPKSLASKSNPLRVFFNAHELSPVSQRGYAGCTITAEGIKDNIARIGVNQYQPLHE